MCGWIYIAKVGGGVNLVVGIVSEYSNERFLLKGARTICENGNRC